MSYCCVSGCSNKKSKIDCRNKTFFRFPLKNSELLRLWLRKIKIPGFIPSSASVICSDHFEENSFTRCPFTKRRTLKQEAAPVIFRKNFKHIPEVCLQLTPTGLQPVGSKQILPGAVPSIFPHSPSLTSSEPSNARENADDKGIIKEMGNLKTGSASLQEQVKEEKCVEISANQEPHEKSNLPKSNFLAILTQNKTAIILLPRNEHQASPSVSGTESQNVAEKPIVIKQEPVESTKEPPWPVIEKIYGAEEIASSSSSSSLSSLSFSSSHSSSTCDSVTIPPSPFSNPDSTNMDETSATHVPNKPAQKRKIDDSEPGAAQAKLCHLTKPSMPSNILRTHLLNPRQILNPMNTKLNPTQTAETAHTLNAIQTKLDECASQSMPSERNGELHPPAKTSKKLFLLPETSKKLFLLPETSKKLFLLPETSKKLHLPTATSNESSDRSPLPTQNDEDATREMFQSLLDGAENNPLFGSRTTEGPGDLFDVFADLIAGKLRGMDWNDCAYALRVILDVVFKTGQVQHDS